MQDGKYHITSGPTVARLVHNFMSPADDRSRHDAMSFDRHSVNFMVGKYPSAQEIRRSAKLLELVGGGVQKEETEKDIEERIETARESGYYSIHVRITGLARIHFSDDELFEFSGQMWYPGDNRLVRGRYHAGDPEQSGSLILIGHTDDEEC